MAIGNYVLTMSPTLSKPGKLVRFDDVDRVMKIVLNEFGESPMAEQVGEKLLAALAQVPAYDGALSTHSDKAFEKLPGARRFLLLFETLISRGLEKNVAAEVAARVAILDDGEQISDTSNITDLKRGYLSETAPITC
jgi:hypothetical protein